MSSNSLKQCGVSSQTRSISDIIESLRSSFQSSDFKAAVNEIMAREEGLRQEKASIIASLREKLDFFEGERNELMLEKIQWKEEHRRLKGELDVNDDQFKEITRELGLTKEKAEKVVKRYEGLINELKDMEEEKTELIRSLAGMTDMVDVLRRDLGEKEEVIDELMRGKECQCDTRLEDLVEAQKKIEYLKDQKDKCHDLVKELRRCDEQKDERIKKLSEDIELLGKEKIDTVKEKDRKIQKLEEEKGILDLEMRELKTKYGQVEERFTKLEQDVITHLCLDLGRDKDFAGSQFGKILSKIILSLDSGEFDNSNGGLQKYGDIQKSESILKSHSNDAECGVKSEEQPVEIVRTCACKRTKCANLIIIDSDDDDSKL